MLTQNDLIFIQNACRDYGDRIVKDIVDLANENQALKEAKSKKTKGE